VEEDAAWRSASGLGEVREPQCHFAHFAHASAGSSTCQIEERGYRNGDKSDNRDGLELLAAGLSRQSRLLTHLLTFLAIGELHPLITARNG
jgi:hypothetical protein